MTLNMESFAMKFIAGFAEEVLSRKAEFGVNTQHKKLLSNL